jgi:hypothetical protein
MKLCRALIIPREEPADRVRNDISIISNRGGETMVHASDLIIDLALFTDLESPKGDFIEEADDA